MPTSTYQIGARPGAALPARDFLDLGELPRPLIRAIPTWDHVPSNQLLLELQTGSGWTICTVRDRKKRRIEDNLLQIPLAILRYADDDKRETVAAAEEAR